MKGFREPQMKVASRQQRGKRERTYLGRVSPLIMREAIILREKLKPRSSLSFQSVLRYGIFYQRGSRGWRAWPE
jgi:hypothetical protein